MAQPHDSFWELERKNRRETALLVVVFLGIEERPLRRSLDESPAEAAAETAFGVE